MLLRTAKLSPTPSRGTAFFAALLRNPPQDSYITHLRAMAGAVGKAARTPLMFPARSADRELSKSARNDLDTSWYTPSTLISEACCLGPAPAHHVNAPPGKGGPKSEPCTRHGSYADRSRFRFCTMINGNTAYDPDDKVERCRQCGGRTIRCHACSGRVHWMESAMPSLRKRYASEMATGRKEFKGRLTKTSPSRTSPRGICGPKGAINHGRGEKEELCASRL